MPNPPHPSKYQGLRPGTALEFEVTMIDFHRDTIREDTTLEERVEIATKWKDQGNQLFKRVGSEWDVKISAVDNVSFPCGLSKCSLKNERLHFVFNLWRPACHTFLPFQFQGELKLAKAKYLKAARVMERTGAPDEATHKANVAVQVRLWN